MNQITQSEISRRELMLSSGALVFAVSAAAPGEVLAQAVMPVMAGDGGKASPLPTELDSWLSIARDGKVTVYFGKIDGGQGTDLAMAMIVADEMDVPLKNVAVIQGDTALTVNQGGASGSTGVRFAGTALRQAGAEARRVLLVRAGEKLGVMPERLTVTDGVVSVAGDASKKISYAEVIGGNYFRSPVAGASVVAIDESSIAGIPGARVVRKGDFVGVVAPREWDAILASQKLRVTWSQVSDPFPEMAQLYDYIRKAPVTKNDEQV